jgi:hypothetical protein
MSIVTLIKIEVLIILLFILTRAWIQNINWIDVLTWSKQYSIAIILFLLEFIIGIILFVIILWRL